MTKEAKEIKSSTTNYMLYFTNMSNGESLVEVKRRFTRKDKKAGVSVDTDSIRAKILYSAPDEFKVSYMTITLMSDFTEKDFGEIIEVSDAFINSEDVVFLRVPASYILEDTVISKVLSGKKFVEDPNDKNFYECERSLPLYISMWMAIGMCLGAAFSNISSIGFGMGLPIGISLGICIGAALDSSEKKKRKELKEKRTNCFTQTITEDGEEVKDD